MGKEVMELTVEQLVAMGYSQEDAENIVGSNEAGSGGLPFPILKINYDAEIPHLAKKGEWVGDVVKDDDGEVVSLTNFGNEISIIILASYCQYSRYDSATNKADIISNIFPLSKAKKAYDLKSGTLISELKKDDTDNKIKFQEIMLVLASSKEQPEPKPYILYAKGTLLYSLNQCRKPLVNRGNVTYTLSFKLKMMKKGNTKYYVVDENSFVATPRSLADIKKGVETIPTYVKEFNRWVEGVNSSDNSDSSDTKSTPKEIDLDEDDLVF